MVRSGAVGGEGGPTWPTYRDRLLEGDFRRRRSNDAGRRRSISFALKGQGRASSLPGASGAEDVAYRSGHWMLELPRVAGGRWQLDLDLASAGAAIGT